MRQTLTAIILVLATLTAKADLPGPAYQYDMFSQNRSFYYKAIPFYNYDQTNFGKTIVYDTKTKRKLYQIDNYLPQQAFLSKSYVHSINFFIFTQHQLAGLEGILLPALRQYLNRCRQCPRRFRDSN